MTVFAPVGRGRGPLRVDEGGTGADNAAGARTNLDVPSLTGTNAFTGANSFSDPLDCAEAVRAPGVTSSSDLTLIGTDRVCLRSGSGPDAQLDMTPLTANRGFSFPDAAGYLALQNLTLAYVAKTGTYTLTLADCVVDATSGTWAATLPTAVGCAGKVYIVKNSGAGTITLATTGGQTIDGAAPGTIAAGNSLTLVSTGANWIIV